MTKYILLFSLMCSSVYAHAADPDVTTEPEAISIAQTAVRITVQGYNVRVQFAEGQLLEVYDIVGKKQAVYSLSGADETITLQLPKGYYLLKVGKQVRKIAL